MPHVESLWPRLAELPLVVESCEYERLHAVLAHEFQRVTTHVRLLGAGADGLGEDVSIHVEDGSSLHETQPVLPLAGEWTLAGFCDHLATLDPWPRPPEWETARHLRNWAFESAALDLALRQAGRALHDVLGLEPQPVRFVNSLGLGEQPSIEHVRRRLARSPGVRFKLDAEATWSPALVDEVAATGAVGVASPRGTVIVARGAVDRRTGQNGEAIPAVFAKRGHRPTTRRDDHPQAARAGLLVASAPRVLHELSL
jgi:hypothetical protein